MDTQLRATITANDQASRVFQQVGKSAERVGDAVEQAGRDGEAGFRKLGDSAKTNARSFEDMERRATAVGAALGTVGTAMIAVSASYRDQQRQISGITQLYGEQSTAILQMAEDMQSLTKFSNDAAREGALIASSLSTNYGITADQIAMLVERSGDLATVFGTDLADAVQRTAGAIRGEGEAAEALGLNMSDAAIAARALDAGITNWNVPGALSEAEKAAFRFQVFLEDTSATAGAAAAAADNAGGRFRQFANEMQDAGQAIGGFLGPVGQVAAEMSPIAIALPVVAGGLGKFSTALRGTAIASRSAALGLGAVSILTSPLALGLGAIAASGLLLYKYFDDLDDKAQELEASLGNLQTTAENLRLSGETGLADEVQRTVSEVQSIFDELSGSNMEDLVKQLGLPAGTQFIDISGPGGLNDQLAKASSLFGDFSKTVTDTVAELGPEAGKAYIAWVNDLLAQVEYTVRGTNLDEILTQVITTPASQVPGVMDAVTGATTATTESMRALGAVLPIVGAGMEGIGTASERMTENLATGLMSAGGNAASMAAEAVASAEELAASMQEVYDRLLAVSGMDDPLSQWNLSRRASEFAQLANNAMDAGTALDTVFRVTVGNTNAIAQQAQGVQDWIGGLTSVEDGYSQIAELRDQGFINETQYHAVLEAEGDILRSNEHIQRDILTIQALQAPLIEDQTEALETQLHTISNLPAEQQLIALGWMDATDAGRAMEFQMLAVAAASGELGANGEAAFTSMITGAAAADPVLKALLVDMGLISEGADGTITVNAVGADQAMSDMDQLTIAILNLQALMGDQSAYEIAVEIYGKEEADKLFGDLAAEDGKTRTTTIQANVQVGDGTGGAGGRTVEQIVRDAFGEDVIPLDVPVEVTPAVTMAGGPNAGDGTGGAGGRTVTDIVRAAFGEEVIPVEPEVEVNPIVRVSGDSAGAIHAALTAAFGTSGSTPGSRLDADGTGGARNVSGPRYDLQVHAPVEVVPDLTIAGDAVAAAQSVLDAAFSGLGDGGGGYEVQAYMNINANDNASPVINAARGALDAANGAVGNMQVMAVDSASSVIGAARGLLSSISGAIATVFVNGDNSGATGAVSAARGALSGISGFIASTFIHGDESDATGAVGNAQGALNGVDGNTASISVLGENSGAMGAIGEVAAYDGALLATSYIDIITRNYTRNIGGLGDTPFRHGGIAGYAHGGVTAELAEAGPELLHFAGGGTAMVHDRGVYTVPEHTYVSPHNTVSTSYGGNSYHFHNHGTIVGMDDFEDQLLTKFASAIAVADERHLRGMGVTA